MGLETKRRDLEAPPRNYDFESAQWDNATKTWVNYTTLKDREIPWPTKLKGKQVTASENHPGWRSRSRDRFSGDIGGPFRTEKFLVESKPTQVHLNATTTNYLGQLTGKARYDGVCWAVDPNWSELQIPTAPESSDTLLAALGTEAIASAKPTNSIADLATFLGELYREGLPRAFGASRWRSKTDAARKTSGDYLGLEFGYKPIVGDILDFATAVRDYDAVLAQYERDSGKMVRRSRKLPTETGGTHSVVMTGARPYLAAYHSAFEGSGLQSGWVTRTEVWSRRRWFEGAFTYYLPSDYHSRRLVNGLASKASVILGTDLTPEVLWNLTPWSWAIDWVSNAGDVLSFVSDMVSDGLVLRYGYMMEHSFRKYIYAYHGSPWYRPSAGTVVPAPLIISHEVKKRVKATPFGFGLTWESFTARQIAILTALGITRSK